MRAEGLLPKVSLLREDLLVQTGPVDQARWNFRRGVLGWVQRRRFQLVLDLIAARRFSSLLELGFGSGIFLPTLARFTDRLHGLDVHDANADVHRMLAKIGEDCMLRRGNGRTLPYPDASFDAVVAVSVIEFIEDLDRVCSELRRVLKPGGRLFVVMPGCSPLLDLALYTFTGRSARSDYGSRRERVVPTLEKHFTRVKRYDWPLPPLLGAHIYRALEFRNG